MLGKGWVDMGQPIKSSPRGTQGPQERKEKGMGAVLGVLLLRWAAIAIVLAVWFVAVFGLVTVWQSVWTIW